MSSYTVRGGPPPSSLGRRMWITEAELLLAYNQFKCAWDEVQVANSFTCQIIQDPSNPNPNACSLRFIRQDFRVPRPGGHFSGVVIYSIHWHPTYGPVLYFDIYEVPSDFPLDLQLIHHLLVHGNDGHLLSTGGVGGGSAIRRNDDPSYFGPPEYLPDYIVDPCGFPDLAPMFRGKSPVEKVLTFLTTYGPAVGLNVPLQVFDRIQHLFGGSRFRPSNNHDGRSGGGPDDHPPPGHGYDSSRNFPDNNNGAGHGTNSQGDNGRSNGPQNYGPAPTGPYNNLLHSSGMGPKIPAQNYGPAPTGSYSNLQSSGMGPGMPISPPEGYTMYRNHFPANAFPPYEGFYEMGPAFPMSNPMMPLPMPGSYGVQHPTMGNVNYGIPQENAGFHQGMGGGAVSYPAVVREDMHSNLHVPSTPGRRPGGEPSRILTGHRDLNAYINDRYGNQSPVTPAPRRQIPLRPLITRGNHMEGPPSMTPSPSSTLANVSPITPQTPNFLADSKTTKVTTPYTSPCPQGVKKRGAQIPKAAATLKTTRKAAALEKAIETQPVQYKLAVANPEVDSTSISEAELEAFCEPLGAYNLSYPDQSDFDRTLSELLGNPTD